MSSLRGNKNISVGIFVDGLDLKLAKLSLKKGHIYIDELHSVSLARKLEDRQPINTEIDNLSGGGETFALNTSTASQEEAVGDNNNILLGLLSKYPISQYVLSYAIAEPSIYYHILESDFGLKG
ncbi:MAG TPA: hypothetical protein VKI62_05125, partial [Bacteroidota bacterium]|nr:hypothetical protein [Bacteroidota bacterium]